MRPLKIKLNQKQKDELGKTILDTGKFIFLGTTAAFVLPPLNQTYISVQMGLIGLFASLLFILLGVILLGSKERK